MLTLWSGGGRSQPQVEGQHPDGRGGRKRLGGGGGREYGCEGRKGLQIGVWVSSCRREEEKRKKWMGGKNDEWIEERIVLQGRRRAVICDGGGGGG